MRRALAGAAHPPVLANLNSNNWPRGTANKNRHKAGFFAANEQLELGFKLPAGDEQVGYQAVSQCYTWKIGASSSLLIATITLESFIPARC